MVTLGPEISVTNPEDGARLWRAYADPVRFVSEVLGESMYRKQAELLRAIWRHSHVSIVGANGTGKDWCSGRIITWWLSLHRRAKVVVIGPTDRQVKDVVWNEARVAYAHAEENGFPLGGRMLPEAARWHIDEERFAVGFSTNNPQNIQGYHSPRLLVIVTEAHNVEDSHINAVERLNPARMIMTGNPFSSAGRYYDSHVLQRHLWHPLAISAFDVPNVQTGKMVVPGLVELATVERHKATWGEDHPMYRGTVLGEFPEDLENSLISMGWVKQAVDAEFKVPAKVEHVVGVDVARFGTDDSVICHRKIWQAETPSGTRSQARLVHKVHGHNTREVAGRVIAYLRAIEAPGTVVVDDVGVGAGVSDSVGEALPSGWRLERFQGGARPLDMVRFADKNAEAWYMMREALKAGELDLGVGQNVSVEALEATTGQLVSRAYKIQGDAKIRLESKDDMRKRGRQSPDEADSLAMTYSARKRVLTAV